MITPWQSLYLLLFICSLPSTKMTNTDLARLLKSDEIQAVLRAPL